MTVGLPDAAVAWALTEAGPGDVVRWEATPLTGGAVAARVERIDVTVARTSGGVSTVRLVRKWTWEHEVLGLKAAQAVVGRAPAIPLLLADGRDETGPWLITPFHDDRPVARGAIPPVVFESMAALHARYRDDWEALDGIPVVDAGWWHGICVGYALSAVDRQSALRPHPVLHRAGAVLRAMADDARVGAALARLPRTLLHGDVHPGNILGTADGATLVDWGSARIGPAMLDLANVTRPDSPGFAAYARTWEQTTGTALGPEAVELGYRWAAVQIPVQYLAWVVSARRPDDVAAVLDQAESALAALPAS